MNIDRSGTADGSHRLGDNDHESSADKLNRTVAGVFGATYTLVAILGFLTTDHGRTGFAGKTSDDLIGLFGVNTLHNVVHLAIGLGLLFAASKGWKTARGANLLVGGTYLLVAVYGFFALDTDADIIGLNHADNFLHLFSGAALTAVALAKSKDRDRRVAA